MEATIRRRSATGKPSSRMNPADRYSGRAPDIGQVVDGAVDGQVADVAAGEEQRRDHVGVGGERQPGAADGEAARRPPAAPAAGCGTRRGRPPRSACWVALPPAPCDSVMRSSCTRALRRAGPVDAVQHLLLAGQVLGAARARVTASSAQSRPARAARPGRSLSHAVASLTRSRLNRPKL